jgi:hypothetical protein
MPAADASAPSRPWSSSHSKGNGPSNFEHINDEDKPAWSEMKTKAGKERKRLPLACIARAADFLAAACDACQRQTLPLLPGLGLHLTPSRKRLPLACIACRRKKIRCSGEKPACKHCTRSRIPYVQNWTDHYQCRLVGLACRCPGLARGRLLVCYRGRGNSHGGCFGPGSWGIRTRHDPTRFRQIAIENPWCHL